MTDADHESSPTLARELDDAFRNRALIYWSLYEELRAELGAERAAAILGRAIERRGAVHLRVTRCPLKDAGVAAGLGPADLATICKIAGRLDTGCFGAAHIGFAADTWTPGASGCCHLHLLPARK